MVECQMLSTDTVNNTRLKYEMYQISRRTLKLMGANRWNESLQLRRKTFLCSELVWSDGIGDWGIQMDLLGYLLPLYSLRNNVFN